MIKPELVKKIKDHFDLNIYETKVWLALLSKGIVSAGETAEISGVPRSRTYDVLESLAKRGFAIIKIGKPVKYIAVEPRTIIEKMKSNALNEAQERVKSLSILHEREEYAELEQLYKSGISPVKAEDLSGAIKGKTHINTKIREMIDKTQKDMTICTSAHDFERRSKLFLSALQDLDKKNVKAKIVISGDESDVKKISQKYNIKAKHTTNQGRFIISDKTESLFMITKDNAEDELGIWISAPYFTQSLHAMFESSLR